MGFLKDRGLAFYYSFRGLGEAFRREIHMKIHGASALLVIVAGFWFGISRFEWMVVTACIILVLSAEIVNTVIEKICDVVQPERDDRIRYIKDISAGFVLLVCLLALVCGLLVFWPYLNARL